jgi:mannose-6-phosphate isomerase-like protein (cupin superfamily)
MATPKAIGPEDCRDFAPDMFVVNHAAGEKLCEKLQRLADPIDHTTLHCWMLSKDTFPELHYHDHDEYWAWVKGKSIVTIRLPDGRSGQFEVSPGWIVHCIRGVEHTHRPHEDWGCYEWTSVLRPGAREGHLVRQV